MVFYQLWAMSHELSIMQLSSRTIKFLSLIGLVLLFVFIGSTQNFDPQPFQDYLNQFPLWFSGFIFVVLYVVLTFFIVPFRVIFCGCSSCLIIQYASCSLHSYCSGLCKMFFIDRWWWQHGRRASDLSLPRWAANGLGKHWGWPALACWHCFFFVAPTPK